MLKKIGYYKSWVRLYNLHAQSSYVRGKNRLLILLVSHLDVNRISKHNFFLFLIYDLLVYGSTETPKVQRAWHPRNEKVDMFMREW